MHPEQPGDETPKQDDARETARREALKRFGQFAAIAPATMILLAPHHSHAGPPPGKGPQGGTPPGQGGTPPGHGGVNPGQGGYH
jgi:hypothetical protein